MKMKWMIVWMGLLVLITASAEAFPLCWRLGAFLDRWEAEVTPIDEGGWLYRFDVQWNAQPYYTLQAGGVADVSHYGDTARVSLAAHQGTTFFGGNAYGAITAFLELGRLDGLVGWWHLTFTGAASPPFQASGALEPIACDVAPQAQVSSWPGANAPNVVGLAGKP
jgi:hypothetical protein